MRVVTLMIVAITALASSPPVSSLSFLAFCAFLPSLFVRNTRLARSPYDAAGTGWTTKAGTADGVSADSRRSLLGGAQRDTCDGDDGDGRDGARRDSEESNVESAGEEEDERDTIRVRIWRALASGEELSLTQLSAAVGERRRGELVSHLSHVERQARSLRNKGAGWRVRRGLPAAGTSRDGKIRLRRRRASRRRGGAGRNEVYVRLE